MSQLSLGLPSTVHVQSQRGTRLSQLQTRTDNAQRMGITSREPCTVRGTARKPHFSRAFISVTVQLWTQVCWVISVYFNIRNTLPKSGRFFLGHPVLSTTGASYVEYHSGLTVNMPTHYVIKNYASWPCLLLLTYRHGNDAHLSDYIHNCI